MSINAAGFRIFLSCKPCDMRKSFESFARVVKSQLQMDPFDNSLFVFCNRACDKCKILHWSNNGWWLYYRKLSRGFFRWKFYDNRQVLEVSERQFRWLLDDLSMDQPTAHQPVKQRLFLFNRLTEMIRLNAQRKYGARGDTVPYPEGTDQLSLFNEVKATAEKGATEPSFEEATKKTPRKPKKKGKREQDFKDLAVTIIKHELPADEQICPVAIIHFIS